MENTQNNNFDGLINPNDIDKRTNKSNQIKEVKVRRDGLLERSTKKVITNDGRQLLGENGEENVQ